MNRTQEAAARPLVVSRIEKLRVGALSYATSAGASAGLASALVAAPSVFVIGVRGAALLYLLLLPVAFAASAVASFVSRMRVGSRAIGARIAHSVPVVRAAALAVSTASVVVYGAWESNTLLLAGVLDRDTCVGYGLTAVLALVAAWTTVALTRRGPVAAAIASSPRAVLGVLLIATALPLAAAISGSATAVIGKGATLAAVALELLIAVAGAVACRPPFFVSAALTGAAAVLALATGGGVHTVCASTFTHPNAARVVVAAVRAALDRDGDGFSAALDGGDCDDGDRTVFPLSRHNDCLGWRDAVDAPAVRRAAAPTSTALAEDGPTRIVLVTIDAFRCGFGVDGYEQEPLRSACPELTALAAHGVLRVGAHTAAPSTRRAIHALFAGTQAEETSVDTYLPSRLRAMGYDTSAIVTHPYVFADARVRASFEHVDESLERTAMDGRTTTSRLVTGRVLEKLASVPGRVLVWAHYLDPHAPYVHDETSPFAWPHAAAYVREVQRTDAAVGELARALADLPDAEHTLLLVTADHGEQFGDHGAAAHGLTLYEDSVRVPMLAWSPGAALTARLRQTPLPTALEEVGAYVVALATGAPFAPADASFFYTTFFGNAQFAVVRDGMKLIYHYEANVTELFDLRADPHEMRDLADARPEEVRRLGVLVAARYFDGRVFSLDAPLTAASAMP